MTVIIQFLLTLTIVIVSCIEYVRPDVLDDSALLLDNPVFQQLMARVNALEAQDKLHQTRISELESLDKIHQTRISELESRDHDQQQRIHHLEDVVRNQQQQLEVMQLALQTATESNEVVAEQSDDVETKETHRTNNDDSNKIRRQQPETDVVAFTAILVNPLNDLGLNQNIRYDLVETNIGNAYNQHHGVFTAPVAGTYVFYTSVFSPYNDEKWVKIVVNGVTKVAAWAHGSTIYHDQGSQMLVVHLNQGDDVAIQNGNAHNNVFGNTDRWTTFSGFLLHADTESANIVG